MAYPAIVQSLFFSFVWRCSKHNKLKFTKWFPAKEIHYLLINVSVISRMHLYKQSIQLMSNFWLLKTIYTGNFWIVWWQIVFVEIDFAIIEIYIHK